MSDTPRADRRAFLRTAGTLAAGAAALPALASCERGAPVTEANQASGARPSAPRRVTLDRGALDALAAVVLPAALGRDGQRTAAAAFAAWVEGYAPVAEEMHGYGYADVRYLPPDPAPGWQAQLAGLDLLARRSRGQAFAALAPEPRRAVVEAALREAGGERLPAPLAASHVAVALLAHWAASPAAWDLAWGARIAPATCRPLGDAPRRPLPLAAPGGTAPGDAAPA
jgi:hypothetical protein